MDLLKVAAVNKYFVYQIPFLAILAVKHTYVTLSLCFTTNPLIKKRTLDNFSSLSLDFCFRERSSDTKCGIL